ncbi:MAG: DNA polymerase [Bacilli bacterium]
MLLAAYTLDTSSNTAPEAILSLYGANFALEDTVDLLEAGQPIYAGQVAYFMPRLWNKLEAELHIKDGLSIFYDVEMPLALVLAKMELEGFPIDGKLLSEIGASFKEKLDQATQRVYEAAGHEFNVASPKQVAAVLFDELGLPKNRKGSTGADVLKSLSNLHPLPSLLLEHRKYAKLLSTYIDTLIDHIYPDGKLHAVFNQALTSTGRLSSTDPNLQNIALRDEEGRLVRQAFYYPDPNYVLMSFDYSQIELRILAHLSHCPALIEVFNRDEDIHAATAKRLFAHEGEITSLMRRRAKAVNFGIIYGISDWGLSEQLEIPPQESRQIINAFYAAYPEIKQYMIDLVDQVQKNGFVTTLTGRRRYLREIHDSNYQTREFAKRAAMNAPIQGTAADLIKLAMIKIDDELTSRKLASRLVLQIHDELVFKVPLDEIEIIKPLVLRTMENALPLNVKLQVVATQGRTWYDLKD